MYIQNGADWTAWLSDESWKAALAVGNLNWALLSFTDLFCLESIRWKRVWKLYTNANHFWVSNSMCLSYVFLPCIHRATWKSEIFKIIFHWRESSHFFYFTENTALINILLYWKSSLRRKWHRPKGQKRCSGKELSTECPEHVVIKQHSWWLEIQLGPRLQSGAGFGWLRSFHFLLPWQFRSWLIYLFSLGRYHQTQKKKDGKEDRTKMILV